MAGLGGVVQYMVATYRLYLRVSGQFHLVVGMLCLFGFNLPETHHLYFLASGFTDFWRRINIYWKDFMMKLFYYPAFFALQELRACVAVVRRHDPGLPRHVAAALLPVVLAARRLPDHRAGLLFWGRSARFVVSPRCVRRAQGRASSRRVRRGAPGARSWL